MKLLPRTGDTTTSLYWYSGSSRGKISAFAASNRVVPLNETLIYDTSEKPDSFNHMDYTLSELEKAGAPSWKTADGKVQLLSSTRFMGLESEK